jgi:Trk-type K+ transport system membrane component
MATSCLASKMRTLISPIATAAMLWSMRARNWARSSRTTHSQNIVKVQMRGKEIDSREVSCLSLVCVVFILIVAIGHFDTTLLLVEELHRLEAEAIQPVRKMLGWAWLHARIA